MTLELAEAWWTIGTLPPEELPDVACSLLESGIETPAVVELAGLTKPDRFEGGVLFERILRDLARRPLSKETAARIIAAAVAQQIIDGSLSPYDGAAKLAYKVYHEADRPSFLDSFYYLADEWEDHSDYRANCEVDILAAAQSRWQNRVMGPSNTRLEWPNAGH